MAPATPTYDSHSSHQPSPDTIPILDLSSYRGANEFDDEFSNCVAEACELGCFRVVNHGIPDELLYKADKVCREVFRLPTPTKKKNTSPVPYGGYLGGASVFPFFESLGIVGVPNAEAIKGFSALMWPNGNQNFCEIMEDYTANLVELSKRIHQIFLRRWGVGKYYDTVFGRGFNIFRMNLYDVGSELVSESVGLMPHTDGDSLTFLLEDDAGGLQVMNNAGNWVAVKSIPNTIVVFVGDSFQAWSNGRIRSVKHRVMVRKSRLSLCLFSAFPDDMEIETPSELANDEHPQRYRAFRYGDLVDFKMGEGKKCENHLETFAGMERDFPTSGDLSIA